jgi:16S rRNA (cytosine967-C5)-methyltransferase
MRYLYNDVVHIQCEIMNKVPFREHHLFELLKGYSSQTLPLDLFINHYFRDHHSLGSKDRAFIAEAAYALVRWQSLLDFLAQSTSWQDRYATFLEVDFNQLQERKDIPLAIRVSFPQPLFDLFVSNYGVEKARELCLISNTPAPATVRANTLKISRKDLLKRWEGIYDVSPTSLSLNGIIFHKKLNFFQLPEFKEGLFEVQDEGSQLLACLIQAQPEQQVLDYCAGSGGKTLAFAPLMQGKGQIYLHDIRPFALQEARKRLRRSGIQNYQIIAPNSPYLAKLKKKMNWILVDVPCSGTGTLRRNPDMKWKFDLELLKRLIGQQRTIFEKALSFLNPNGRIVYATCSLLREENQAQVEHFLSTYSLTMEGEPFQTFPTPNGMDGFFGVVLKRA